MLKNFVLAAMVGLGIAGLIFVSRNALNEAGISANQQGKTGNNIVTNQPFVEKLTTDDPAFAQGYGGQSQKENLTELFAKSIGKTITQANPDGPANVDGKNGLIVPDVDSISGDLLAQAAEKFDPKTLRPEIKDNGIKISSDENKESLSAYFASFKNILQTNAEDFAKNLKVSPEENFSEYTAQMIAMYQKNQKDFYNLQVPKSLSGVHKKEIELLGTAENVLKEILNYEADPLSAIMASEYNNSLDKEFADLKKEISRIMEEKNISI